MMYAHFTKIPAMLSLLFAFPPPLEIYTIYFYNILM